MIRVVILDVGGVILYSNPLDPEQGALNRQRMAQKWGFDSVKHWKGGFYGSPNWKDCKVGKMTLMQMLKLGYPDWADDEQKLMDMMEDYRSELQLHPELQRIIERLHALPHVRVFVLSNHEDTLMSLLEDKAPQVIPLIEHIFNSYDIGFSKPDPRSFQTVLDTYQLTPEHCLFVDDKQSNIDAAKGLGIDGFCYENNPEELWTYMEGVLAAEDQKDEN